MENEMDSKIRRGNSPQIQEKEANRRTDERLPLQGLNLKIRKYGVARLRGYQPCHSIDLSTNGLACTSEAIILRELEKVDFLLTLEEHSVTGTAIVCYQKTTAEGFQYGLMFLNTFPELRPLLNADNLSTRELTHLAETMAEHLVDDIQDNHQSDKNYLLKKQQLWDTVHVYVNRLTEMGLRIPTIRAEGFQWVEPIKVLEVSEERNQIVLHCHDPSTKSGTPISISIMTEPGANEAVYSTADGYSFESVLEVINYIGDKVSSCARLS